MQQVREVTRVAGGFSFLEGPRWHRERLYVSDFYTHRVLAFDAAGQMRTVCTVPGQPSGLGFLPDGTLLVVSMTDRRLMRLDGDSLSEVADLSSLAPFWCNDMLVDNVGRAYVGNFGWDTLNQQRIAPTCLILVRPDGRVETAANGLVFPNGVVLADSGRTLLVAETFAARISAFDVAADGTLSNRRLWASFAEREFATLEESITSGALLPDGMVMDGEGTVWFGDAGGQGAIRVAEGGRVLDRINARELSVYAVALGGADRRSLYMCASSPLLSGDNPMVVRKSQLLMARVDVPAAPSG
jgi:sugar lactone lactonase YvrE